MVWRYLRLLGCEASLADDLVQDTFVTLLEKPFCVKGDPATASYLRRVARNRFVDEMRRLRLKVADNLNEADLVWEEAAGDDDGETWRAALRHCLEKLDGRPRRILELRYQDQMTIDEVAHVMSMKASGVKSLLGRVKDRLRECVTRKARIQ